MRLEQTDEAGIPRYFIPTDNKFGNEVWLELHQVKVLNVGEISSSFKYSSIYKIILNSKLVSFQSSQKLIIKLTVTPMYSTALSSSPTAVVSSSEAVS